MVHSTNPPSQQQKEARHSVQQEPGVVQKQIENESALLHY